MRSATRLLKHVPLIRFVGGPHQPGNISSATKQHPCAPEGVVPGKVGTSNQKSTQSNVQSTQSSYRSTLKDGEVASRAQLSPRFRYAFPKDDEAENIISGGAAIVF